MIETNPVVNNSISALNTNNQAHISADHSRMLNSQNMIHPQHHSCGGGPFGQIAQAFSNLIVKGINWLASRIGFGEIVPKPYVQNVQTAEQSQGSNMFSTLLGIGSSIFGGGLAGSLGKLGGFGGIVDKVKDWGGSLISGAKKVISKIF